jgi:DNA-binding transcriptional LysR family regulator
MRHRRTTAAGKRLGLSQSAVSHALSRLRDLFDDPLFTRKPHGLEPTRRALELAPRIDALIDLTAATVGREGAFDPAHSERRFNLGAQEFIAVTIGAPLVASMRKSAPHASFAVEYLQPTRALASLMRGEIDLALGRFGATPNGIVLETLYTDLFCVVARKGHPRLKGKISASAYAETGHVFAGTPHDENVFDPLPDPRRIRTIAIVPVWLTALAIVAASDAIATCPRRLAERQAKTMGLQVMETPFPQQPFIKISVARRIGSADAGIDWLLAQIQRAVQ